MNMIESDALNLNAQVADRLGWKSESMPSECALHGHISIHWKLRLERNCECEFAWAQSLDVCRELLDRLTDEQKELFCTAIYTATCGFSHPNRRPVWDIISATPEQLCRAFLEATKP